MGNNVIYMNATHWSFSTVLFVFRVAASSITPLSPILFDPKL